MGQIPHFFGIGVNSPFFGDGSNSSFFAAVVPSPIPWSTSNIHGGIVRALLNPSRDFFGWKGEILGFLFIYLFFFSFPFLGLFLAMVELTLVR